MDLEETMGMISIAVPGDINLTFKIDNVEEAEKIIDLIQKKREKKRSKKKADSIVGIWKDRFDESIPSEEIQKQWREKNWERY
ncbi:MAG: hypothetical protein GY950_34845 [bacterium]|nr:hypothetical protein [bacterium]